MKSTAKRKATCTRTKVVNPYVWRAFSGKPSRYLPPEKRYVLVQTTPPDDSGRISPVVLVGWLKYAAGDKSCPYFVLPGVGGNATHFCDCLGDDFNAPGWNGKQIIAPAKGSGK